MIGFAETDPIYQSAYYMIPIDIPEAKTFIAEEIEITISLPGEPILFTLGIGGYDIPQSLIATPGVILSNQIAYSIDSYGATYTLSDYQKLAWYNSATQSDMPAMTIYIYDPYNVRDGLSSYALDLTINITGQTITTWSLQDSVNVVIGGSIALNGFVMVYMSDAVDFGGRKKDLRGSGSGYSKKRR
jgi:hypothetical protein